VKVDFRKVRLRDIFVNEVVGDFYRWVITLRS